MTITSDLAHACGIHQERKAITIKIRASSLGELFDCPARWEAKHLLKTTNWVVTGKYL